jgi:drug/metabolite transporter (DMT)-like permease
MQQQKLSLIYGLATVLLWSTVATAFKLSLRYLSPTELLLISSLTSTLVIGAILALQGKLNTVFHGTKQDYLRSLLLGLLNPFLYYLVLFKGYALLPAQQAQSLNYTWAITLSLLAVPLLKQKLRLPQILALIISYCGIVTIASEGHPLSLQFTSGIGVALILLSTVFWSLYWILNTRDRRDPIAALFVNFLCGLPLVFIYYLLTEPLRLPPWEGIGGAVYVGLFEMGICFVLWLKAMKLSDNTAKLSNLIFISPFLSLIFISILLGEKILSATFAGLFLIIVGLLCQRLGRKRQAQL